MNVTTEEALSALVENADVIPPEAFAKLHRFLSGQPSTAPRMVYPAGLTDDLQAILGQMVMDTAQMARVFRQAGAVIPSKVEYEQAFILDKMIRTLLIYPNTWRQEFNHSFMLARAECQRIEDARLVEKTANRLES